MSHPAIGTKLAGSLPKVPDESDTEQNGGPLFSAYGLGSALLSLVCVAAVVLTYLVWSAHRERIDTLSYQARVAQAAVDWTGVLINMNKDNVDSSLAKLRDGTVGELNKDFEGSMQPFRDVMLRLQTRSKGQIDSASIESLHHNLDSTPSGQPPRQAPPEFASQTNTVLVVATSVSDNAADPSKPQTVHWNLRVDVSDVEGKLLVSRLEWIR